MKKILFNRNKICSSCLKSFEVKGKVSVQQFNDKKYCSNSCRGRGIKPKLKTRIKMSNLRLGEKHWNWQGGKTDLTKTIRKSFEYKEWRKAVFERDGYKCVACGAKGYLQADHIKPFALFPKLRFEISNGRTLCIPCHKKTDTFAQRVNRNNKYTKHLIEKGIVRP